MVSLVLGILIGVFPTMARADLTDGLISAWNFEEGAGQEAKDSVGENHGELKGAAARIEGGQVGRAIEFDGIDAYVEVPDNKTLQIPGALTVAAWIKPTPDNTDNNMAIVFKGHHIAFGAHYSWRVATRTPTGLTWGRCSEVAGPEGYWFTFDVIKTDTWHHVALVCDGTTMRSYVDAEDITGVSGETGMNIAGPYAVYDGEPVEIGSAIGWDGTDSRGYFSGIIDEVLIYDRALSKAELKELFDGAIVPAVEPVAKLATVWGAVKQ